jgi:hypothetical protein
MICASIKNRECRFLNSDFKMSSWLVEIALFSGCVSTIQETAM